MYINSFMLHSTYSNRAEYNDDDNGVKNIVYAICESVRALMICVDGFLNNFN